jgi:hypothetical protein
MAENAVYWVGFAAGFGAGMLAGWIIAWAWWNGNRTSRRRD